MATGTLDLDLRDPGTALSSSRLGQDPFDPPPPPRQAGGRRARAPSAGGLRGAGAGGGGARAPREEPFAVRGCVLPPDEALENHSVVVAVDRVQEITAAPPAGMAVIDSGGIVLPGLIDLHGHPEYNVFSAWEPPKQYANRYAWRRSAEYDAVVRGPWSLLTGTAPADGTHPSLLPELTRYAEARALIGGCTAIQGASGKYPDKHEALVRNVDLRLFGQDRARSVIDLGRLTE